MRMEIHFIILIFIVFLIGAAFGFTSKLLWEYRIYIISLVAGYVGYFITRKVWMGAVIAVIAYILLGVVM